jgi:hypothetical protein
MDNPQIGHVRKTKVLCDGDVPMEPPIDKQLENSKNNDPKQVKDEDKEGGVKHKANNPEDSEGNPYNHEATITWEKDKDNHEAYHHKDPKDKDPKVKFWLPKPKESQKHVSETEDVAIGCHNPTPSSYWMIGTKFKCSEKKHSHPEFKTTDWLTNLQVMRAGTPQNMQKLV